MHITVSPEASSTLELTPLDVTTDLEVTPYHDLTPHYDATLHREGIPLPPAMRLLTGMYHHTALHTYLRGRRTNQIFVSRTTTRRKSFDLTANGAP